MTDSEVATRMHNYQMQRTVLRAAADPDRSPHEPPNSRYRVWLLRAHC